MLTVILTGGASRRMGRDKAALPLAGRTMALTLADRYAGLGPVAFAVDREGRFDVGSYGQLIDRFPGQGPMNGIVSAFLETDEDMIFLTATDMPDGGADGVRRLMDGIGGHEACLYEDEPLFALYRRSCLAPAMECLALGQRSLRRLLQRIDAVYLPKNDGMFFTNLNTPEEYERFIKRQKKT